MKKELNQIVDAAKARGWVQLPHKKHLKLQFQGKGQPVFIASTPSDRRALLNIEALFRRVERTGRAK